MSKRIIDSCSVIHDIPIELTWKGFLKEQFKNYDLVNFQKHFNQECFTLNESRYINKKIHYNKKTSILKKSFECKEIIGYDTETYQGMCKLLCDSKGNHVYNGSFDDCINLLTRYRDKSNVYRFFFNIDFDITSIFRLLIREMMIISKPFKKKYRIKWKSLILKWIINLARGSQLKYKNYYFKWISRSFFSIQIISRKRSVIFTDLFNFFQTSLNEVAKDYINLEKDDIDGSLLNTSLEYWQKNKDKIIKYCYLDCEITKKSAQILVNTIRNIGLPIPRALVSPASISKHYFRLNNKINDLSNIPIKALQIGLETYAGGRFEVFEIGSFEKLYLADINSQYPSFIKNLPDLENGYFSFKNNGLPIKETFGFYYAEVNIPKNVNFITTAFIKDTILKFPVGNFKQWFTWYDLDLIRDYIIKIYDVIEYFPFENCRYPFKKRIDELYKLKTIFKPLAKKEKKMEYRLTKIVMNGLYGTMIEIHDIPNDSKNSKAGVLFNPIYASFICAFGRWSVLKPVPKEMHSHVKAIHTDSIILNIYPDFLNLGNNLGEWSIECKGKGYIIGTGQYEIGDICKTRGIPKKIITSWSDFLKENWNKKEYEITFNRMRKIRESIIQDESDFLVNTITENKRIILPLSDSKRVWQFGINTFNDLIVQTWKSCALYYDYQTNKLIIDNEMFEKLNSELFTLINSIYKE